MTTLKIRNWDTWQTYRKGRGQPPWIKVHRALMRDVNWVSLTDAQRGQLVAIWMLAADHNGAVPADPKIIKKLCFMEKEPDLEILISYGFLEGRRHPDANMATPRRQHDAPEEKRGEAEEKRAKDALSSTSVDAPDFSKSNEPKKPTPEALMDFWNDKADPSLSRVREMPTKRREKCAARLKEHPDGVFWKRVVERINRSAFLLGRRRSSNWKVTFDWIVENQTNALKIAEGQYDDDSGKSNVRGYHERVLGGEGSPAPIREGDGEHQVGDVPELQPGVEQASPLPVSGRE